MRYQRRFYFIFLRKEKRFVINVSFSEVFHLITNESCKHRFLGYKVGNRKFQMVCAG